jgi:phage terminase large subunit-like protein
MMARTSLEALIAQAAPGDIKSYVKASLDVVLRNDAKIRGFSTESPDSIRGCNFSGAWFDDADAMRYYSFYNAGLLPALRAGKNPRLLITAARDSGSRLIQELEQEAAAGEGRVYVTYA